MRTYVCNKEIGESFQRMRRRQSMSQQELAFVTRIDRTYIARIEKGTANPTINILVKLSKGLKVKLHDVIDTV